MSERDAVGSNQAELVRRSKYGIQTACAFLAGAFLAYGTSLSTSLSTPYLIPLMAAMMFQQTIGMTVLAAISLLSVMVPICVFFFLLQKGLGYHDYAAIAVLIFFTTWLVAYRNPAVAQRKMPLVIIVIFYSTLCNTPPALLPSTFSLQLLEALVIGMCVGIAAALVVFLPPPSSSCTGATCTACMESSRQVSL